MKSSSKIRHVKGVLRGPRFKIGIVVAEFNEYFTSMLLEGAVDELVRWGVSRGNIDVFHVPGAFEIPFVVKRALKKRRYHAMITLGVVLKGQTRHYRQVADAAGRGTLQASLESDIPVIHGVVTADSKAQAVDRIGGKLGHRGRLSALAALKMAGLAGKI